MAQPTMNPYNTFGTRLATGLDAVATAAPATAEDIVGAVYAYIQPLYYSASDTYLSEQLKSVLPFAINQYMNSQIGNPFGQYNLQQQQIIFKLLETFKTVPIQSMIDFLLDIEDNIPKSGLSIQEQVPLFQATAVGKAGYSYWLGKAATPAGWTPYLDSNVNTNRTMVPEWTAACMEGVLLSAGLANTYGLVDPPRIIGIDTISALTSAIGIAAWKVIFRNIPELHLASLGCSC